MRRPLILVALLYVTGILLGTFISAPLEWLMAQALILCLVALCWVRARQIVLPIILVMTGWTGEILHTAIISPDDLRRILGSQPELVTLRGTLRETPSWRVFVQDQKESWRTLCRVDVTAARLNHRKWQPAIGQVAVMTSGMLTNFFAGQIVEVSGVAHQPKTAAAEGTFDYRAYLQKLEIYYQLDAASEEEDWRIVASPSRRPIADYFGDWARQALAAGLPVEDEALHLEWALTLGWKTALTEDVAEPFVRAATYHIFAVDGLRMAIIFGIFFSLLRALTLPRAVCGLLLIPILWFYTALTGWPASAVRATVMLTIVIVGWVLKRPTDLVNSLFAAAILILIWQPQQLFQAGFQLSFLVVLSIVLMMPMLRAVWARLWALDPLLPESLYPRWRKTFEGPGRFASDILLTSLAAWVGSIPLVACYFHIITPISTPANFLAVPLCGLVLMSNLASLLLMGWFPAVGILFNHAGWFLMECIRVTSRWFAIQPGAAFYVSEPNLFSIGLYYWILLAALTGLLFKPKLRIWTIVCTAMAAGTWVWQCSNHAFATRLHILPANGGMAIYFDAPGVKNDLLIDCGTSNSVAMTLKPFLRAQGVNRLSTLALTHGDVHHIGGAKLLTELFKVEHVCVSPVRFRSAAYRKLMTDFENTPGKVHRVSRNEMLGQWTVVHPEAGEQFPQADDNAIVLHGLIESTPVLLVSDLGRQGQEALLERAPTLRADIVITGLPTRPEAVGDAFLECVKPRLIIVVDSEYPISERANPKFKARLAGKPIPVLYTRSAGSITIEWRNRQWELRTMSGLKMSSEQLPNREQASPENSDYFK